MRGGGGSGGEEGDQRFSGLPRGRLCQQAVSGHPACIPWKFGVGWSGNFVIPNAVWTFPPSPPWPSPGVVHSEHLLLNTEEKTERKEEEQCISELWHTSTWPTVPVIGVLRGRRDWEKNVEMMAKNFLDLMKIINLQIQEGQEAPSPCYRKKTTSSRIIVK